MRRRDPHLVEVEARLVNWARWSTGGLPYACQVGGGGAAVDELDAEVVEFVLLIMKQRRPGYWLIVECRYQRRWADETAAGKLGRSLTTYKGDVRQMLSWCLGQFDAADTKTGPVTKTAAVG